MTMRPGMVVWRAIGEAAVRPTGLCAGGTIAAAAALFQSGTLLCLALAAYGASAGLALLRRRFWQSVVDRLRRQGPDLPFAHDFKDPVARTYATRLANARFVREEAAHRILAGDRARSKTEERSADLEEAALPLLWALERVASYLTLEGRAPLRDQVARLGQLTDEAAAAARAEYGRAIAALERKLSSLEEMERKRHMVAARLEAMVCALETMAEELSQVPLRKEVDQALADQASLVTVLEEMSGVELSPVDSEVGFA